MQPSSRAGARECKGCFQSQQCQTNPCPQLWLDTRIATRSNQLKDLSRIREKKKPIGQTLTLVHSHRAHNSALPRAATKIRRSFLRRSRRPCRQSTGRVGGEDGDERSEIIRGWGWGWWPCNDSVESSHVKGAPLTVVTHGRLPLPHGPDRWGRGVRFIVKTRSIDGSVLSATRLLKNGAICKLLWKLCFFMHHPQFWFLASWLCFFFSVCCTHLYENFFVFQKRTYEKILWLTLLKYSLGSLIFVYRRSTNYC